MPEALFVVFLLDSKGATVPEALSWFFNWIPKVQKFVNLVDLVKSFQIRIYLQTSASIKPRTRLSEFAKNY